MTRSKVKVKVTSNCKPLKRSRPSVPHGAKFCFQHVSEVNIATYLRYVWIVVNDSLTANFLLNLLVSVNSYSDVIGKIRPIMSPVFIHSLCGVM